LYWTTLSALCRTNCLIDRAISARSQYAKWSDAKYILRWGWREARFPHLKVTYAKMANSVYNDITKPNKIYPKFVLAWTPYLTVQCILVGLNKTKLLVSQIFIMLVHQVLVLGPLLLHLSAFNAHYQFIALLNFHPRFLVLMPFGWFICNYLFPFLTEMSFLIYAHFCRNTTGVWNSALVYMGTECNCI
jgi:hypothetical protein